MSNKTQVSVYGNLVADPELRATRAGEAFASVRLAVTSRSFVREQESWVDGETSYYRVAAFGALGTNLLNSLKKGDPLVVHGSLTIRDWNTADGQPRREAQVVAEAAGHNLRFGRSEFRRENRPVLDLVQDSRPDPQDDDVDVTPDRADTPSEQTPAGYTVAATGA